jgi:hypothetical protein
MLKTRWLRSSNVSTATLHGLSHVTVLVQLDMHIDDLSLLPHKRVWVNSFSSILFVPPLLSFFYIIFQLHTQLMDAALSPRMP